MGIPAEMTGPTVYSHCKLLLFPTRSQRGVNQKIINSVQVLAGGVGLHPVMALVLIDQGTAGVCMDYATWLKEDLTKID